MTCREKLKIEHPEYVNDVYAGGCKCCPYCYGYMGKPNYCEDFGDEIFCRNCWNREIPGTENIHIKDSGETVNHPKHYGREGAVECIDEMVLVFGVEATMNFCLLNAWKYRYRAADKNGAEDLKKSDWYIAKYKELKGGDINDT